MSLLKKKATNSIWILLLLLSLAAAVIKCFVGFDIDEGYAVSMPYRLLQGDHLFLDMWEVHQTSSFLPALALLLYQKITGAMNGCVLFLRIVTTVLHGMVSLLVYKVVRKNLPRHWAILLALLYFNLLPKWLISLDFSMQQVWGMTFVLGLLDKEIETGKNRYAFWMGIALAASVLSYPGMVLSYPALLLSLWMLHKGDNIKTKFNKCIYVTLGCALMAILFLLYVLSSMGVKEFLESIPMVFMDGTHQFTMETKLMLYMSQWANVGKQLLILSLPSFLAVCIVFLLRRKDYKKYPLLFLGGFVTVTSLLILCANIVGIAMGPFHFQVRYLLIYFFLLVWSMMEMKKTGEEETRRLFWGPMFQMFVAFVAILIFSNVGPDSSSSYLGLGLIGGMLFLYKKAPVISSKAIGITYWLLALFVLSLVFCKGYYVRITEYGPSNVLQERFVVSDGPLAGIYVAGEDYDRITSDYETIRSVTEGNKTLLYLGTEGISNLYGQGIFVSPSTISTPAFNEQWVTYFEMYPEKVPDVVVLAKNTIDDRDKFFAENPFGIWLRERYDISSMDETDSLCVINRK